MKVVQAFQILSCRKSSKLSFNTTFIKYIVTKI